MFLFTYHHYSIIFVDFDVYMLLRFIVLCSYSEDRTNFWFDKINFLTLLSGCSRGGMKSGGLEYFEDMVGGETGIKPHTELTGIIVDFIRRA